MSESGFSRLWNSLKPPPSPGTRAPARRRLKPKQKRLLTAAGIFLLLAGAGFGAYSWVASAPQRAEAEYQAGMKFMQPGHYQEAIPKFTRAVEIHPLASAYVERGFAHRYLGQNDQAAADLEKAIDLDSGSVRAYSGLGSIYRDRGDTRRAVEQYSKSIQISGNVDALFERGQLYESLGEHQKAVDDFTAAIERIRDAPYIYRARAMAKSNMGDADGAEADRNTARSMESPHR